jgi:hypothetical protein
MEKYKSIVLKEKTWERLQAAKLSLRMKSADELINSFLNATGMVGKPAPLKTPAPKSRTMVINKGEPITEVMQVGEGAHRELPERETVKWSDAPSPDAVLRKLKEEH